MINRGSEWRKWDLHFHTPSSYDYEDKSITNEKIIEILEEKEISVVAITDHHFIDVERIIELQKLGLEKGITILPGIEFRAELGGSESIHYIGIFSEALNKQQLDDVWIKIQSTCKITKTDIENIGGDAKIQCDFKETSNLIHNLGGLVTVHAGSKTNTFENITNSLPDKIAQKVGLVKGFIDIFELGKETDQISYNEKVFPNLGFKIPMIICSDNHKITEYIVKQNLWIKADPTFEGLKQIIYEPEERVKIQKEQPESEKLDNLMIDKVTFTSSNNRFTPETIYFNKNLNVIIGGKSSGKSILLYNIAKTLYENQNDSVLKYKDANDNKEKDLYDLKLDDSKFDFTVENYLGVSQSINREDGKKSILGSIKYIPQNHLSDLVDKSLRNSNELKKYIRNLLREDPIYNKIYEDFVERLGKNDEIRKNDISQYFTFQEELKKKNEDLQHKGDKESINKGIEALEKKIAETKKDLTPDQTTEYNSLTNKYSELEKNKNSLLGDLEKIYNFCESAKYTLNELKAKKTLLIDNLELADIKNEYTAKLNFIDDAILENENIKKLVTKGENEEFQLSDGNIFSLKLNEINKELNELNTKLIPLNNLFENQSLIITYQKTISEEKIKIAEIEQIEKEKENITKTANDRKVKIFEDIKLNRELYDKLLKDFSSRIDKIKEEDPELKIEGKIYFNFPKYREIITDFSQGNSKSYSNYKIFNEENKALMDYDFEKYLTDLKVVFENIENGNYKLRTNTSKQDAIIKILEQKHFFDHWDITYKNDTIHKMSTGKASLVLLKVMIKLSDIKGPILIDQPEDNLDNRSVTNELVQYLKEKKKERQIILVTHNANIVVNADAENIIIANQRGQSDEDKLGSPYLFDYVNGAIENIAPLSNEKEEKDLLKSMGIREHITQIVEGGKEAFKKREEKYGF